MNVVVCFNASVTHAIIPYCVNHSLHDDLPIWYWGRRGPSVHLNYELPPETNAELFYNEVTVPPNADVEGSFFMACGFGEGYFGFQVNSDTERRVLFSVWSPYKTDNPDDIPEEIGRAHV